MKWEDFLNRKFPQLSDAIRIKTDIECPKCGNRLWKRLDRVITSNPPQYQYECDCGFVGYHTV